jgi:hypothetical protein
MENENNQEHCPKWGRENPDGARYCNACGGSLPRTELHVEISKVAIASCICALFALGCFVPGLVAALDPRALDPESDMVNNVARVSILAGGIAMLLGVLALAQIADSGGRRTGYGFAVIGTAIPPILIFVLAWFNIGRWGPTIPHRMACGTNLSGLGKAMLIYAGDYDEKWPIAAGSNSAWAARIPDWKADNPFDAFALQADKSGGQASVSSSLYFLIRYCAVTPKTFVCKGDYGTTPFKPVKYGVDDSKLTDLWDFGPNPPRHCSYSYHQPYGPYRLTTASEPGLVVAADRNPWIDSPFEKARDFQAFDPNGNQEQVGAGNAAVHKADGQNVLFLDCHVGFERNSICGINGDNIYTYWDGADIRRGTPPRLGSQPIDRKDSLLVNDPAVPR